MPGSSNEIQTNVWANLPKRYSTTGIRPGHRDRVAKKNYTQVTDQHFGLGAETLESGDPKVTQKAAQQARETATQGVASESDRHKKTAQNAGSCTTWLPGAN